MTFTSGSGNEVVCLAMHTLAKRIVGRSLADLTENMAQTWRTLVSGQIRWIGPEVLQFTPRILPNPILSHSRSNSAYRKERSTWRLERLSMRSGTCGDDMS